jgi:hypothetical protein
MHMFEGISGTDPSIYTLRVTHRLFDNILLIASIDDYGEWGAERVIEYHEGRAYS